MSEQAGGQNRSSLLQEAVPQKVGEEEREKTSVLLPDRQVLQQEVPGTKPGPSEKLEKEEAEEIEAAAHDGESTRALDKDNAANGNATTTTTTNNNNNNNVVDEDTFCRSKASASRQALRESLAVMNAQLSKLSRKQQKDLLNDFDLNKLEAWKKRKVVYERLLATLDVELLTEKEAGATKDDEIPPQKSEPSLLSSDLRGKLVSQLRSYMYACRGMRIPAAVYDKATTNNNTRATQDSQQVAEAPAAVLAEGEKVESEKEEECDSGRVSGRDFLRLRKQRVRNLMKKERDALESLLRGSEKQKKKTNDGDDEKDQTGQSHDLHVLETPNETRVNCIYALKGLKLLELQRKVRQDVLMEKILMGKKEKENNSVSGLALFDHTRLSRLRQDIGSLSMEERKGQIHSANLAAAEAAQLQASRLQKAEERALIQAQQQARLAEAQRLEAEQRRKKRELYERARAEHQAKLRALQGRKQFLQDLVAHRDEHRKFHSSECRKLRKQRTDQTMSWHSKERKKKIREANARVLALRSDNIEEYIRMAKEAKNSRITMLLENTEGLLLELGIKVADQRASTTGDYDPDQERDVNQLLEFNKDKDETKEGEDLVEDNLLEGQKRYLNLVHSKVEEIEQQPQNLEGGHLRAYQLQGLQWMVSLYVNGLHGILADEMGLGKTIQSISLFAYLIEKKGNYGPHLVICPKAVLSNWCIEFQRWLPGLNVILYDGNPQERRAIKDERMANKTFNVILTHYDMIMRDKKVLSKINWEYLLIDEGHRLKNKDSKLSEILRGVYQCRNRLLLTGTPIQNNLKELWSLLNFVLPKVFDTSDSFDDWFSAPFQGSAEDVTLSEEEELLIIHRLHQVIRPFLLRRKKSEVEKELPDKSMVVCKCSLSAWQKIYYKQITGSGSVMLESRKGAAKSKTLMNSAMQLRKTCIHPYLFLDSMDPPYQPEDPMELIRASGKFELLDRILPKLKATGHRVLLFSQMTRAMDLLEDYLEMKKYKYLRLDGETKTHERPLLLAEFNAPGSDVFLFMLSTRAGGLGLNLQTADTVILFDSDWNPQMDKQAEDRAHRIGQKKQVKIITLVTVGSIEEVIIERARQKADIDNKVIQAGMFNQSSSHKERNESLNEIFQRGIQDIGKGLSTDEEVNRLIARTDDEVEIFAKIDEERRLSEVWEKYSSKLLVESEVPEWAAQEEPEEEKKDEEPQVLGKRRAREKKVIYDDGLTDRMWAKLVDDGQDIEEVIEQQKEKADARKMKRLKRKRELEEAGAAAGKRGRK